MQLRNLDQIKNYTNQALKTIIADSNHIESILSLASSKFMANFSIFSLKHNRISPSQVNHRVTFTSFILNS